MRFLLKRDLLLARDRGWSWSLGVIFFVVYASLLVIALPSGAQLAALGPAVVWSGAVYGLLLAAPASTATDIDSGAIDHLRLYGHSLTSICLARAISLILTAILPLLPTAAFIGLLYGMDADTIARLLLGLFIAIPALAAYTVFIGVLISSRKAGGLIGIVIALPLLAPLVIFGVSAATTPAATLWASAEFLALAGLSLISTVIALFGAVAALKVNVE